MLYVGSDPIGWVSELLTAVTNTNCHIYTAAPCFSLMEKSLIKTMGQIMGYDPETLDGLFCPGGTYSNMMSLLVARNEAFPHVRQEG